MIIKILALDKRTRTIDTKILNQLPNINILTPAHEYATINEIGSTDEPEKLDFKRYTDYISYTLGSLRIKRKQVIKLYHISRFILRRCHQIFSEKKRIPVK